MSPLPAVPAPAASPATPSAVGTPGPAPVAGRVAHSALDPDVAARLRRDAVGLVAAVVQQHDTGEVLMVGWMDDEALHRTLTTGRATYWSRSRQEYWVKGATSGHRQHVVDVRLDCDGDALLVLVDQEGPACHTGTRSCFASPLPVSRPAASAAAGSRSTSAPTPDAAVAPVAAPTITSDAREVAASPAGSVR
jgi:phosphoribosyl-AMP cyclohydrolase